MLDAARINTCVRDYNQALNDQEMRARDLDNFSRRQNDLAEARKTADADVARSLAALAAAMGVDPSTIAASPAPQAPPAPIQTAVPQQTATAAPVAPPAKKG